jgi:hypothetical protein
MNKEFKRMMELAGLTEMKINDPSDLSNPTIFKHYLNRIPNEKYFYVADEEANIFFDPDENGPDYVWDKFDDEDLVDYFYDPIFDNELKGKKGIEGDSFDEWRNIDGETNPKYPDDQDSVGIREIMLYDKIQDIISDYKKKHFSHLAN